MSKRHELRRRVIRLAHARPDLRPHLLPLLAGEGHRKEGYFVPMPSRASCFGFEGPDAERRGRDLARATSDAVKATNDLARNQWRDLARDLLQARPVDAHPELARVAIADALRFTYLNLAEKVFWYFENLPKGK